MAGSAKYQEAGQAVRQARLQLAMTQADVASRMGVSHVTVSRWERGKVRPSKTLLRALVELLQMRPELLARAFGYTTRQEATADRNERGALSERISRLEAQYLRVQPLIDKLALLSDRERRAVEAMVDELLSR